MLPARTMNMLRKFKERGSIDNLLLVSSSPGTGKSTIGKALVHSLKAEHLFINMSQDGGVDTVREVIEPFSRTMSMNGKNKIVILDEIDSTRAQAAQESLKAFIEAKCHNCQFIMTANIASKIMEPLKGGRTSMIDMDYRNADDKAELSPKIMDRLRFICEEEQAEYEEEVFQSLVDKFYPNIRRMVEAMNTAYLMHDKIDRRTLNVRADGKELAEMVLSHKPIEAIHAYINENVLDYKTVFSILLADVVYKVSQIPAALECVANFEYRASMSSMPEAQMLVCMGELQQMLKDKP